MWARNEKAVEDMKKTRQNKQYLPGVILGKILMLLVMQKKQLNQKKL